MPNEQTGKVNEMSADRSQNTIIDLVDKMEELVINAKSIPFSGNCVLNREELLLLVGMVKANLPNEVKQAKWILNRQHQVIEHARTSANKLMAEAETRVAMMINEHEITLHAKRVGQQMVDEAYAEANDLRRNAREYIQHLLRDSEEHLTGILLEIQKNRSQLNEKDEHGVYEASGR